MTATDMTARIVITVADAEPGETMDVYRQDGSDRAPVLGAIGIPATSTVIIDAECRLNRPQSWVVVLADGSEAATAPLTLTSPLPVLSDPWAGVETMLRVVDVDDELTVRSRMQVVTIEGDKQPVAVGDVPTGYYGQLQLLTVTDDQAETVAALALSGQPMLLRCSCGVHPDRWIQPTGDLTPARLVKRPIDVARLHLWSECIYLPGPPRPGDQATGDTLEDLHEAAPGVLADIATMWATLGEIAATDLSGGI
ncbi:MAG: hypothetical protein QM582_09560 [Micropruina sp.]|uniref:hypothetical protein n=1 Tax=Micropruina sp. TaxID=2737536 RepID=UPI0039E6CC69